jgi:APA family basic amino acid/polyamine antiporter
MTCIIAMLAFNQHHMFNGFKHLVVPAFGLIANLMCMVFYLVGPFFVPGMSPKEPYIALIIVALWGGYGLVYFMRASRAKGKAVLLGEVGRA